MAATHHHQRMFSPVQIIDVDHEAAILLPEEALARLNAKIGDELEVVILSDGIELKGKDRGT